MKLSDKYLTILDELILVPAHAIYIGSSFDLPGRSEYWLLKGFQRQEVPLYIDHVRFAVRLTSRQPKSLLVFSGGQTSSVAGPQAEAQGYWSVASHFSWWHEVEVADRATTEEFARDSFENVLFSIARFKEITGKYPSSIDVVGWEFKRMRFDLHRKAIKWSQQYFMYHGVNDPLNLRASLRGELAVRGEFQRDPYGTDQKLASKRRRRNPFRRSHPYSISCPEIAPLLYHRSADDPLFKGSLPWNRSERQV